MTTGTTHAPLQRIIRQYNPRVTAWYDRFSGTVATQSRTVQASKQASISRLLEWAFTCSAVSRPNTIYITGGDVASDRPGWDANDEMAIDRYWSAPVIDGWEITRWHRDPWSVTYKRAGITVIVAMGAAWYGDEHSATECDRAHVLLGAMLRHEFDRHAVLMGSPGRTGADLLQRSLPEDAEYYPLPQDIQTILEQNFGQGRMEQNDLYRNRSQIPGMWILDARWMYAGSLRHLPVAPVTYDRKHPKWEGYRRAVYKIATRVPDHWDHLGLVPTWSKGDSRTVWPHTPGTFIDGAWLTGAELAGVYDAGWPVDLRESIVYATEEAPGHDPARAWIERMIRLREWAALNKNELCLRASRHLVIDAVGYVHRPKQVETHFAPYGAHVPAEALLVLPLANGIRYTMREKLDPATDPLYKPEWAVQVWGASRAKLAKKALEYRAGHILWLRNDSLVLDYDPAAFEHDTGKIGSWRVKSQLVRTIDPPLTEAAYRELMREAS